MTGLLSSGAVVECLKVAQRQTDCDLAQLVVAIGAKRRAELLHHLLRFEIVVQILPS